MKTAIHQPRCTAAFLAASTASVVLTACGHNPVAERPPSTAESPSFATQASTIAAQMAMPLTDLSSLVNSKIPQNFHADGNGEDVCVSLLVTKACAGTKYDFDAQRTGAIKVTPAGPQTLRVSLPVSFSGHGGFRGDVASIIKADKKSFEGALTLNADLTPRLTEDWCPQLDAAVSYAWTSNPRVEIIGGVWVDVRGQVENKLNSKLPELVAQARGAIDCNKFRSELSKVYGTHTFPVTVPQVGQVSVNVLPRDIRFSGLNVTATDLTVAASLTADIDVSDKALPPELLPLPKLKGMDGSPPRLSLAVPVRVGYGDMTAAVNSAVAGKTFSTKTPAGAVSVKVNSVEIYPSRGKLVIGIDMDADLPAQFLDTKGTVYLLATPKVDGGTKISLPDATYSTVLDSKLWTAASVLFEGQIRDAIRSAASRDIAPDIARAKETLARKLSEPALIPGLTVSATNVDMKVGRVAVASTELAVEGLLGANVVLGAKP